ncbi:hypothetical protein ACWFQ8_25370 [Streptomyces sp. NPDC055254]
MPCVEIGLPGTMPGKSHRGARADSRELRPQLGLFGEVLHELGEPRRQRHEAAAQDQVRVASSVRAKTAIRVRQPHSSSAMDGP